MTARIGIAVLVFLGMLLSIASLGAVPGERAGGLPQIDCPMAAKPDAAKTGEHHDGGCPGFPHHHHHNDGCLCMLGSGVALVGWEAVCLCSPAVSRGAYEASDEFPPEAPIFSLDKPPLI